MTSLRGLKKDRLVPMAVFAGLFFVSLVFFLVQGHFEKNLLLFFPLHDGGTMTGEARNMVRQRNIEEDLQLLLEEIILGPADIRHSGVLHRKTRVRSVLVRDREAYLDFSADAIFVGGEIKMSFQEVLETVKKTVFFNFPRLKNIVITIEGQVPGEPSYRASLEVGSTMVQK